MRLFYVAQHTWLVLLLAVCCLLFPFLLSCQCYLLFKLASSSELLTQCDGCLGWGLLLGCRYCWLLGVFTYLIPCEEMVASALSSLGTHAPCVVQTFRDPYSHSSGCPRWLQSGMDDWGNSKMCPLDKWDFAHSQIIAKNKNFLFYDVHYFYLCLGTSHPL